MTSTNVQMARNTIETLAPKPNFWRLAFSVALATAVTSSLAAPKQANAHLSAELASGPIITTSDTSSDGMPGMPIEGMGLMLRPDMAPPQGIIGGMSPKQGAIMPVLQYMHMGMEGNRDGTSGVSTAEVLSQFPVAPLSMDVDMLMGGVMYGVTDDISVMAMVPVNAGLKRHQSPEQKRATWPVLAGLKVRQFVGFRFVHRPA